jgi:PAS domain S-box-containing protein
MQQSYSLIESNNWVATPAGIGERVARIASSIVILVACLVLIGWQLDLSLLKSLMPGAATMKVNTAVCLLLAGISLKLQMRQRQTALMARITKWCAFAIITISVLTICEYIFGWNLGIDQLLFPDPAAVATSHPGRMGINTAICLSFTGTALWLIERQERQSSSQPQHQVNVRVFYHLSQLTTSMALHTALSLGILCGGILALTSDRGFMRALTSDLIGGEVAKRFIPQAILIPLLIGWLILQGLQANLYDPNFALSLMSMSMVVIWLGLTRQNAGILNRVDYDRIRSADRIRSSEERLKLALQGAKQGIWDFDLQTQILTWDDRCKDMFGLSPTALVTVGGHLDAIHPDDLQRVTTATEIAIRDCSEFNQEYRIVHSDGTISWILTQGRCYCDPAGLPCRMSGTMMDITERKRQEARYPRAVAALRESEQRFHTLADQMSQLAWMADASGWIFWYNHRWFDYTGTTLAEMQGWGWQQVHHPEHLDRVVPHFRHQIEAGKQWEDTFPLRGKDGTYRWFLSRAIPIFDETGQVLRWFGTNTDITDLKQAQADLEQRNQELDSFVYIVSHDLKAPLRAVANLSQWIEDDLEGVLTADTQTQMTLLRSRVDRMRATIDGLLDYARAGRTEGTTEPVAVAELLLEVIDSLAPSPTFSIEIDPNLPTLNTNRVLLFQVFANLIGNGIKHHDRVDGSIQISSRESGDLYEFIIADDGPGIAPEDQANIFTIFQTGHCKNTQDSTGIGLAIVKKIVESEGGTIRLASEIDRGTTFYFTWAK